MTQSIAGLARIMQEILRSGISPAELGEVANLAIQVNSQPLPLEDFLKEKGLEDTLGQLQELMEKNGTAHVLWQIKSLCGNPHIARHPSVNPTVGARLFTTSWQLSSGRYEDGLPPDFYKEFGGRSKL